MKCKFCKKNYKSEKTLKQHKERFHSGFVTNHPVAFTPILFIFVLLPMLILTPVLKSATLPAVISLMFILFAINTVNFKFILESDLKKLEMTFAVITIIIAMLGIYYTELSLNETKSASQDTNKSLGVSIEMLKYAQGQAALVQEQIGRNAKISFTYPYGPLLIDRNEIAGFWVENTGYRTILLQPDCLLTLICDNNYGNSLARAKVIRIATGRTIENYNSESTIILKIGDLAFFRSPDTVDHTFMINSKMIKGQMNCYVSCPIQNIDGNQIGNANIQIKQN